MIFIPVLFICINAKCEFMQYTDYSMTETECRESVESQKNRIKEMAKFGQGKVGVLEGTCIEVDSRRIKEKKRL